MHLRGNFELAAAAGISIGALAVYELASKSSSFRRWLNDYMDPMILIGTVGELHIHPIKSSRSHMVSEAFCSEVGLRCGELRDRYFVIINGDTKIALTALNIPRVVLIETAIKDNKLTMTGQQADPTTIDLNAVAQKANVVRVSCKGKQIEGLDCGDTAGAWLQQFLESTEPLRLLYFWPGLFSERQVIVDKNWEFIAVPYRKDEVAYPNRTPYMALSQASLDDLNSKFDSQKYEMRNFRPNIVVVGCPAYDEDLWNEVRIGDHAKFVCVRACIRCPITTINPNTAEKAVDGEPLKTLKEYRQPPGEAQAQKKEWPVLGVQMGLDEAGVIKVGDPVYVRYKKFPH